MLFAIFTILNIESIVTKIRAVRFKKITIYEFYDVNRIKKFGVSTFKLRISRNLLSQYLLFQKDHTSKVNIISFPLARQIGIF